MGVHLHADAPILTTTSEASGFGPGCFKWQKKYHFVTADFAYISLILSFCHSTLGHFPLIFRLYFAYISLIFVTAHLDISQLYFAYISLILSFCHSRLGLIFRLYFAYILHNFAYISLIFCIILLIFRLYSAKFRLYFAYILFRLISLKMSSYIYCGTV